MDYIKDKKIRSTIMFGLLLWLFKLYFFGQKVYIAYSTICFIMKFANEKTKKVVWLLVKNGLLLIERELLAIKGEQFVLI